MIPPCPVHGIPVEADFPVLTPRLRTEPGGRGDETGGNELQGPDVLTFRTGVDVGGARHQPVVVIVLIHEERVEEEAVFPDLDLCATRSGNCTAGHRESVIVLVEAGVITVDARLTAGEEVVRHPHVGIADQDSRAVTVDGVMDDLVVAPLSGDSPAAGAGFRRVRRAPDDASLDCARGGLALRADDTDALLGILDDTVADAE